jgi:hypothetical protein
MSMLRSRYSETFQPQIGGGGIRVLFFWLCWRYTCHAGVVLGGQEGIADDLDRAHAGVG